MRARLIVALCLLLLGTGCSSLSTPPATLTTEAVQPPPAVTVTETQTAETQTPAAQEPATTESSSPVQLGQPLDLLVVTPAEFYSEATRIADWKNSTGLKTAVLTLADAYALGEGRDEPEKIKRCLSLYQQQSGIQYAMLLGDGDVFPARFTAFLSYNWDSPADSEWTYYPADLYYADLYRPDGSFDDWDANQNGYFGEIGDPTSPETLNLDQVDLTPDIAVGRVPASAPEEVATYYDKIVAYESNAWQSAWSKRLLAIIMGDPMPDALYEEDTLSAFSSDWQMIRYYAEGGPGVQAGELSRENLMRELEAGVGLVSFLGHGNIDVWADALTVKDFGELQNTANPAIVFSGGCNTAKFTADPEFGPYTDVDGMDHIGIDAGEDLGARPPIPAPIQPAGYCYNGIMQYTLVQNPAGFATYIGCVTFGNAGPLDNLNDAFFRAIAGGAPTVGDAWRTAIPTYYTMDRFKAALLNDQGGNVWIFKQPWIFMLFGDPSLRIGGVAQ